MEPHHYLNGHTLEACGVRARSIKPGLKFKLPPLDGEYEVIRPWTNEKQSWVIKTPRGDISTISTMFMAARAYEVQISNSTLFTPESSTEKATEQ